jgi:hypothetical protein
MEAKNSRIKHMFFRAILSGFIYSIRALILLRKNIGPEKIKEVAGTQNLERARFLAITILLLSIVGVVFAIFFVWHLFYM